MSDYYPMIMVVCVIVGAIMALRIFFTLWNPIDRRLNGDRFKAGKTVQIKDLKEKLFTIHLKSKTIVAGGILQGYISTDARTPFHLRSLLAVRFPDGRTAYIRSEEIEYFEEQPEKTS